MTAQRLRQDSDRDRDSSSDEERARRRIPSLSTVIREAMVFKSAQNISSALEPLLRKVVQEEVEKGVIRSMRLFHRSSSMRIEAAPESPSLKLVFGTQLSQPIFTGSKIEGAENKPLELVIVDARTGEPLASPLQSPIRVEVVVLDGDFPAEDEQEWSSAEFQRNIVKQRTGRRPLITGDVNITMRDASAVISDLSFTDNSSWIRSRQFRIGARVVAGSHDGQRIKEATTAAFMVKDHRGELYRKHYPPALDDEVWRLEKIGKDGAFHKKLASAKIHNVQEFLKLLTIDPRSLRQILGVGMSDKVWEATIAHARTCPVEEKLYLHQGSQCSLLLNPICEVVGIVYGDITLTLQQLSKPQRAIVHHLVKEAYHNWDSLKESHALFDHRILPQNLGTQRDGVESLAWYPVHQGIAVDCQIEDYDIILDPALPSFD
ncbi:protein SAR DEFICIENT 1-like [Curcuma longa]|uniref:protein SAR DEFICIENT 1-like n=1 Tax=Curcuma longa TaxID=136217 RepID=UPI003D9DB45C